MLLAASVAVFLVLAAQSAGSAEEREDILFVIARTCWQTRITTRRRCMEPWRYRYVGSENARDIKENEGPSEAFMPEKASGRATGGLDLIVF